MSSKTQSAFEYDQSTLEVILEPLQSMHFYFSEFKDTFRVYSNYWIYLTSWIWGNAVEKEEYNDISKNYKIFQICKICKTFKIFEFLSFRNLEILKIFDILKIFKISTFSKSLNFLKFLNFQNFLKENNRKSLLDQIS